MNLDAIKTLANVMSVAVATAAILVSAYVAWLSHKRSIMPVLVFLFRDGVWVLKNVGAGPGLNLLIARIHHTDATGRHWTDLTQCYPLAPKEIIKLGHYSNAMELGAVYTDVYGKQYYSSRCRDYSTSFTRGDHFHWERSQAHFEADVNELKDARSTEP
jgi:hypothetical protein